MSLMKLQYFMANHFLKQGVWYSSSIIGYLAKAFLSLPITRFYVIKLSVTLLLAYAHTLLRAWVD